MSAPFLAGVVAGYGIAVPVGAIGALIAGLSARTSLRVGAAAGLGAATADGVYACVAVAGGAAVAGVIAPIAGPLRWLGALVLLALAGWTAWGAIRHPSTGARDERPTTPLRAYAAILGLTLLNPATVIYFAALVLADGGAGGGPWFVLGAFLASASWQLLIAGGGSLIGRLLTGPRGRLITALSSSVVIAVLAVRLLTST
ncbi:lysine transporter LysE [Actinoplanes sp. SE50]|uniref:LysE family transporter n=1 Tax=unclassified Actinoplanes TaxID=2626549 RepID=UPI00023ED3B8|nr:MULTISPECIES: LysE family transporter [unclassified Actinoplanes]AEV82779.1 Putative amino-acid transporter yisU [Actinoplanes sp. SE50/110]ATO81175.1 lysine transporter LysE [Actinoplanes sp. SE50]SLL98582.1 lysine transporter LysE [Actinoplanes sp. SE50/110]